MSQNKLGDLCRPLQAKKNEESFKAKVYKDPFPDASALNKVSPRTPTAP